LRILDIDEDGSISVQELREGVLKTFKQSEISEEDINELINVLDEDKDGKGNCCNFRFGDNIFHTVFWMR
jgi:Ca2+-binding EF-hand superfamily protein